MITVLIDMFEQTMLGGSQFHKLVTDVSTVDRHERTASFRAGARTINDDMTEDPWQLLRRRLKARWVKLTDDDLQAPIDGNAEYLAGRLQVLYGITAEEAKRQVKVFDAGNTYPVRRTPYSSCLDWEAADEAAEDAADRVLRTRCELPVRGLPPISEIG